MIASRPFRLRAALAAAMLAAAPAIADPVIRVLPRVEGAVPPLLFGHFMERASWGEPGYVSATRPENPRELRPDVVALIQPLRIPIIRFPAGTDLDRIDWRDMIDQVPGRAGERPLFTGRQPPPLSNEFGYDEFLRFCEANQIQALLPVPTEKALAREVPLAEAAQLWAGLVAYCNAPVGAKLPEGMPDWPAVRAKNGRVHPYGVKYFQIGNEAWVYSSRAFKAAGLEKATAAEKAAWYVACVKAFSEAMRAVDPSIRIISDGAASREREVQDAVLARPEFRASIDVVSIHIYRPWAASAMTDREGREQSFADITAEQIWHALVSGPAIDANGDAVVRPEANERWDWAEREKVPVAVTEWTGVHWWTVGDEKPRPALISSWGNAVGSAGILHALLRAGDRIELANQSMLVGSSWNINVIRVEPEASTPPHYTPMGEVFRLYSAHHGDRRLAVEIDGIPTYEQPFKLKANKPAGHVRVVDTVVTRNGESAFVHLINRAFARPQRVRIDLGALPLADGREAELRVVTGELHDRQEPVGRYLGAAKTTSQRMPVVDGGVTVTLPERSVAVLVVPLNEGAEEAGGSRLKPPVGDDDAAAN